MKMIIDTDPGVDDTLAIALAHAIPGIELVGLTAVFGNTFVEQSSRNARYLADLLGADVPVAEGAALPWGAETYVPSAEVHGPEGFGDMAQVPQIGRNLDETAAAFLVRMARELPGELVVCAIGPLTNIADAQRLDPGFARNLGKLVIMGGAFEAPGNVTPYAEANIWHDAAAADAVFGAGFDCVMVGLDATMKTLLAPQDFERFAEISPKVGGFVRHVSQFYLGFYRSIGVMDGSPMHDALAVLACTDPERFVLHRTGLRVELEGDRMGQTVADPGRASVAIAMDVDAPWAEAEVMKQIARLP